MPAPTAAEIAAWPAPNHINPVTRIPLVLGTEIPLIILVILFITCRFYSRTVIVRVLGADDWCMLVASILSVGNSIMACVSTLPAYQTGYHFWDLRVDKAHNFVKTLQMGMATQLLFTIICLTTKVSILLTYLRIFPSRLNKWFCYIMLGYEVIWTISCFFIALFQCFPVQSFWEYLSYPHRECLDVGTLYYVTGGLNVVSDFFIFLWPAKDLGALRVSLRQRIILVAMFSLGIIVCIAGICRIWYSSIYIKSYDRLWNGAALYAITSCEANIAIICGCLPGCKPLLSKMFPRIFDNSAEGTNRQSTYKIQSGLDGQSFPFQSLSDVTTTGGIIKEEGYSVSFDDMRLPDKPKTTTIKHKRWRSNVSDDDTIGAQSQEWMIICRDPSTWHSATITHGG